MVGYWAVCAAHVSSAQPEVCAMPTKMCTVVAAQDADMLFLLPDDMLLRVCKSWPNLRDWIPLSRSTRRLSDLMRPQLREIMEKPLGAANALQMDHLARSATLLPHDGQPNYINNVTELIRLTGEARQEIHIEK